MRFHSKYHNFNHHTLSSDGYPDSATDPIASHEHPFQGNFVVNGTVVANSLSSINPVSNLTVTTLNANTLVVTNPISNLTVTNLMVTNFDAGTDGSNLINVNAETLNGFSGFQFEQIEFKDEPDGYAGLDENGKLNNSVIPLNITVNTINYISPVDILTIHQLSSNVAPLIVGDTTIGYELPDAFLPNHITELSSINGVDIEDYLTESDIGESVQAFDSTILKISDIGVSVQAFDSTILKSSDIGESVKGEWVATPSLSSDSGSAGDFAYDNDYLYICVATNIWKRIELNSW